MSQAVGFGSSRSLQRSFKVKHMLVRVHTLVVTKLSALPRVVSGVEVSWEGLFVPLIAGVSGISVFGCLDDDCMAKRQHFATMYMPS